MKPDHYADCLHDLSHYKHDYANSGINAGREISKATPKWLLVIKQMTVVLAAIIIFFNTGIAQTKTRSMAKEGDTVWVFVNHVKADKRKQFEKFVNEIFWPMAKKLSKEDQLVFAQTRVLYPVKPEADGTYSYLFIMDPVNSGGDYDIERLLKKMYDEQEANEYMQMFNETTAGDQTGYIVVQSRY